MQKSYRKNILRDFKGNLSRFLSLFGIVALGVIILTGLVSFAPSMRIAGQKYYVEQNVFDLRILSTLGLSEDDIAAISATDGVTAVEAVKYLDVEGHWSGTDEPAVVRVQQLPADPDADTAENMNRLVLQAGQMPEAADECVVHVMGHGEEVPLGTTLTLPDDTDGLTRTTYTVVGQVQDPQYFSANQETSTAGDGVLDALVFVPDRSLDLDYYTACYVKAKNADQYDNYSDEYQAAVDAVADRLTSISGAQCVARREALSRTPTPSWPTPSRLTASKKPTPNASSPRRSKNWPTPKRSSSPPRPSWNRAKRSTPPVRNSLPSSKPPCPTPCRAARTRC